MPVPPKDSQCTCVMHIHMLNSLLVQMATHPQIHILAHMRMILSQFQRRDLSSNPKIRLSISIPRSCESTTILAADVVNLSPQWASVSTSLSVCLLYLW